MHRRPNPIAALALAVSALHGAMSAQTASAPEAPAGLDETRLLMSKWIESQQIIAKERKDWQQGKEILAGRVDLLQKEIATLRQKIEQTQSKVAATDQKRQQLSAENDDLKAVADRLAKLVTGLEAELQKLLKVIPEPVQAKVQPLYQRIPEDAEKTRVSVAERFQNVLGILNELNKAAREITVHYEVRTLADGKPTEVKAVYVGLAQAYYVSARGEGGIGRPTPDGWVWQPSKTVGNDVLAALEIMQGKHTPAFIPFPVKLQ